MLSLTLIALILSLLSIKLLWKRRSLYWLSWNMPGPISFPFVGSLIEFLSKPDDGNLAWMQSLSKRYGPTVCCWVGPLLHILITKVEHIELVLSSIDCINRADMSKAILLNAIGAESVFTLEDVDRDADKVLRTEIHTTIYATEASKIADFALYDERWRKSRRAIGPSFSYSVVVTYMQIFNKQSAYCVDELRKHVGRNSFNIRTIIEEATVFAFVQSTLNGDISRSNMRKYAEIVAKGQKLIQIRINQPIFQIDFIWNLTKYGRESKRIDKQREDLKHKVIRPVYDSSSDGTLQERLLRIENENDQLTYSEIQAEVTAVMLSGTESTAGPISITLLLLAIHPDIQDKVIDELRQVLPDQKSPVTKEDLEHLHLLDMCVREELRLFPSVPITLRKNKKVLQLDDYVIPANTSILISFHQLQRNPVYWGPSADQFDPYRFLPENVGKIAPSSYLPFGTGTRGCIGSTYAMIVVKTFLVTILRHYKVTTLVKMEDLTADSAITIVVNDSLHLVQLEARDY